MTKKIILLGALLGALFFTLYHYFLNGPTNEIKLNYHLKDNQIYRYQLAIKMEQKSKIPFSDGEQTLEDHLHFNGEIHLQKVQEEAAGLWAKVSLTNISELSMSVLSKSVFKELSDAKLLLENRDFYLYISKNGEFKSLRYNKSESELFKNLTQSFLKQIEVRLSDIGETRWKSRSEHLLGVTENISTINGQGDNFVIDREIAQFSKLHGYSSFQNSELNNQATIHFTKVGELKEISEDEKINFQNESGGELVFLKRSLNLKLRESANEITQTMAPIDMVLFEERKLSDIVVSKEVITKLLTDRVAGLTFFDLSNSLLKYGASGTVPDHNRWLWRATGLLKLNPELALKLGKLFFNKKLEEMGRGLLFDLLTSAGTNESQQVMREILSDSRVTSGLSNGAFPELLLYQRLSFVENPNEETLNFLRDNFQNESSDNYNQKTAKAYTLGSAIGNIKEYDVDRAHELIETLSSELAKTKDEKLEASLIRSLGNGGLESQIETILRYEESTNEIVRIAVATALRKTDTKRANKTLVRLTSDSSPLVQESAVLALHDHFLSDSDFQELIDGILENRTHKEIDADLVTLLNRESSKNISRGKEIAKVLHHLLLRSEDSPNLASRMRAILERLEK